MIKAKINATGEVVDVRPYQTEKYDFMACRNGGIMGELYMRSELTIIGDKELEFVELVKRMRETQKEHKRYADVVVSGRLFRNNDEKRRYVELIHEKAILESEVDEYLKKIK